MASQICFVCQEASTGHLTNSCPKIVCKKCGQKGHISLDCNNNEIVNNENNERKEIQMRQSIACQRLGKAYDRLEPVCGNSYDGLNVLKSLEEFDNDMIFDMTEKEGMIMKFLIWFWLSEKKRSSITWITKCWKI